MVGRLPAKRNKSISKNHACQNFVITQIDGEKIERGLKIDAILYIAKRKSFELERARWDGADYQNSCIKLWEYKQSGRMFS